jgi:ferrous iron transport protein A
MSRLALKRSATSRVELDSQLQEDEMMPLALLGEGEMGEIVGFRGRSGDPTDVRAEDMGLRAGKRVEMLRNGAGPILVKVDESRIAVDRGIAMRIGVRRS